MKTYRLAEGKYEVDRDDRGLIREVRRNGEVWRKGLELVEFLNIFHAALDRLDQLELPIPMVLYCPNCGVQHVDAAETSGRWANPPHRSHLCHACGTIWRPADVTTTGVAELTTQGKADTWPVHAEEVQAQPVAPTSDERLLRQALLALVFHQEQTRPIAGTQIAIGHLRERIAR